MRGRRDAVATEGRQLRSRTRQEAMRWKPEAKVSVGATCPAPRTTAAKNTADGGVRGRPARKRSTSELAEPCGKKRGVKCRRVEPQAAVEATRLPTESSGCTNPGHEQRPAGEIFDSPELPTGVSPVPVHWPSPTGGYSKRQDARNAGRTTLDKEKYALDIQRAMIADEDGDRPLHIAVVHENISLVKRLCSLMRSVGASVDLFNFMRQTPLHLAVIIGNAEVVKALLEEGASVQLQNRNGHTTIHLGVKYFSEECLRTLIYHPPSRAILDYYDYDGYTSLHLAVFKKNHSAINILHHAGCNMNARDGKSGKTPLFHAVTLNHVDTVQLLLKCGASLEEGDYSGVTPLEEAAQSSDTQMMKVLEECSKPFRKNHSEAHSDISKSHFVQQDHSKSKSKVNADMTSSHLIQQDSGARHKRTARSRRFTVESLIS